MLQKSRLQSMNSSLPSLYQVTYIFVLLFLDLQALQAKDPISQRENTSTRGNSKRALNFKIWLKTELSFWQRCLTLTLRRSQGCCYVVGVGKTLFGTHIIHWKITWYPLTIVIINIKVNKEGMVTSGSEHLEMKI